MPTKRTTIATLLFSLAAATALPAGAAVPASPSIKPSVSFSSKVISMQDAALLREALAAVDNGRWSDLSRMADRAVDQELADFILWLNVTSGPDASFNALDGALTDLAGWPRLGMIRVRAEDAISGSTLSHADRVRWFDERGGPVAGEGMTALAVALLQTGEEARAAALLRDAWRNHSLTPARTREILASHSRYLSEEDHQARADFLLWTGQFSDAIALKPRLSPGWRALVDARIALARRSGDVDGLVRAVPAALQSDPGLLFERARWRRKSDLDDSVDELLVQIDGAAIPLAGRGRLWDERNLAVRRNLQDGDFETAYQLSTAHGLDEGVDFAEAEWLAGWLSLRRQSDPARALSHFTRLETGVGAPISLSRARYWSGRSLEALADAEAASNMFRSAADFPFTYYGQLAAEKVGLGTIEFTPAAPVTEEVRAAFEARPLVRVSRMLGEAGEESLFREFVLHLDEQLQTEAEHDLLYRMTEDYQMPHVGLRGAKAGMARGIIAPDAAYPLLTYAPTRQVDIEDALVVALTRQETELNPRAVSSANARGLMQLLPGTARRQAALEGVPYRESWLTDDPSYNLTLGSAHLRDLIRQFNGSYILSIAAYNAGASRSRRWIRDYGDPRASTADPIDWVESIPFSETRNYVQRVLENLQVYRHRLKGSPEPIRLSQDLRRGTPD